MTKKSLNIAADNVIVVGKVKKDDTFFYFDLYFLLEFSAFL